MPSGWWAVMVHLEILCSFLVAYDKFCLISIVNVWLMCLSCCLTSGESNIWPSTYCHIQQIELKRMVPFTVIWPSWVCTGIISSFPNRQFVAVFSNRCTYLLNYSIFVLEKFHLFFVIYSYPSFSIDSVVQGINLLTRPSFLVNKDDKLANTRQLISSQVDITERS